MVSDVSDTTISVNNINHARRAIQRHSIFITDVYQNYILDEIIYSEQIDFEIMIKIDDKSEFKNTYI